MADIGIVRRMDELGRIVIPKEIRRSLRLKVGDEMEIIPCGDGLRVKKHMRFDGMAGTKWSPRRGKARRGSKACAPRRSFRSS